MALRYSPVSQAIDERCYEHIEPREVSGAVFAHENLPHGSQNDEDNRNALPEIAH